MDKRKVQKAPPECPQLSFHKFFPPNEPFPTLTVTTTPVEEFNYFGLESSFDKTLSLLFLQAHVKGNVVTPFESFLSSFREHHLAPQHTAFWFKISISLESTHEYDIPRWHQDGTYWDTGPEQMPYKVGTVILGDSTLFLGPKERYLLVLRESEERLSIANYKKEEEDIERLWRAEQFKEAKVLQGKPGELARWVVANQDFAVIHSEPPIYGPRIYMSFLPGTEAQVRELCRRWKRVFVDGMDDVRR